MDFVSNGMEFEWNDVGIVILVFKGMEMGMGMEWVFFYYPR